MSKASEWAARYAALGVRPEMECPISLVTAEVVRSAADGTLTCWITDAARHRIVLPVSDALALAKWIIDTFGEHP